MSNLDRTILTIVDPVIAPGKIELIDNESSGDFTDQKSKYANETSAVGAVAPFVQIGSNQIEIDEIKSFSLDLKDFIPKLQLSVKDQKGRLTHLEFPLDGDVITIYIRPPSSETNNPIHLDFDIVNVSKSGQGDINTFNFNGVLKIPGIFKEICKSFKNETSYNHLIEVCEDLGLGFASNEDSTSDSMTRICAYDNYSKFIKDTIETSYLNEDSFFNSYIDPFYFMNFVNVNKQFSEEDIIEEFPVEPTRIPIDIQKGIETEEQLGPLVLSNSRNFAGSNIFITKFGLENNSANIWIKNGYKRYCQYFDQDLNEYSSEFMDPLTTEGSEQTKILLKGKAGDDFYKDQVKYKYLGKQPSGEFDNVHDNFQWAKILNHQNNQEIEKMILKIELEALNFNLYRYQRIPILIYDTGNLERMNSINDRDKNVGDDNFEEDGGEELFDNRSYIKNEFLSGYYVIKDIIYKYRRGKWTQEMRLMKREWNIPSKNLGA